MAFHCHSLLSILIIISALILNEYLTNVSSQNNSTENCIFDVKYFGQYCGITLNEKNPNNECSTNMYLCGKSNLKSIAVLLKTCKPGVNCDQRLNGG